MTCLFNKLNKQKDNMLVYGNVFVVVVVGLSQIAAFQTNPLLVDETAAGNETVNTEGGQQCVDLDLFYCSSHPGVLSLLAFGSSYLFERCSIDIKLDYMQLGCIHVYG